MTFQIAALVLLSLMTPHKEPKVLPYFGTEQVECLTQNIYYEAPNETYEGKLAVATVTLNRVQNREFPKTVCGVVYQKGQFSWTKGKRPVHGLKTYQEAKRIAMDVLFNNTRLKSIKNALYFHNMSVTPKWSITMYPIQRIGGHIFYVTRRS